MSRVDITSVGEYLVSTITLDDRPYEMEHRYETAVFGEGFGLLGKVVHLEYSDVITEANSIHSRIVAEITSGTFEGNKPK